MSEVTEIVFAPFLPVTVLAALALVIALIVGWGLRRHASGAGWRAAFAVLALLALADPQMVREERQPLDDIALLVVDETASARLEDRGAAIEAARAALRDKLEALPRTVVEEVSVGDDRRTGTPLFAALRERLAEIDRSRLAGVVALTDGIVHDVPAEPDRLAIEAPFHTLLVGRADEFEREQIGRAACRDRV